MKTFEEYIGQASLNESRQKYIFGGTDNRNTNVMYSKKICELEQGDTIYWCNLDNNGRIKSIDNVDICKFVSLETLKSKNYKLNFSFLLNGKELFGNTVVDKRNLDSTVNEYYNSHMSYTIIGTNLDDLLDKLKDYVKVDNDVEAARKFFEEKEEELRKANESRQNYIFGGTDDRNTVIEEPKTFAELQDGDEIYWWCSLTNVPYKRTVHNVEIKKRDNAIKIYYKNSKLTDFMRIVGIKNLNETSYDYKSLSHHTYAKSIFYCSATSEKEFLKIVNAHGYNFTSKGIIDQTV